MIGDSSAAPQLGASLDGEQVCSQARSGLRFRWDVSIPGPAVSQPGPARLPLPHAGSVPGEWRAWLAGMAVSPVLKMDRVCHRRNWTGLKAAAGVALHPRV